MVHLGDARAAHPDLTKEQFDKVLHETRKQGKVALSAAEGRGGVSKRDIDSAVYQKDSSGRDEMLLYASVRNAAALNFDWTDPELPFEVVYNAFCATGPGGGVNPHCPAGSGQRTPVVVSQKGWHGAALSSLHSSPGERKEYRDAIKRQTDINKLIKAGTATQAHLTEKDALAKRVSELRQSVMQRMGIAVPVVAPPPMAPPLPRGANVVSGVPQTAQAPSLPTVPYKDEVKWETGKAQAGTLNGVDFAPAPPKFWEKTKDADIKEPKPLKPIERVSVMIQEDDGRIWIAHPTNEFGNRKATMPGGGVEKGLTDQQNALKEVWEETGLQVEITKHLGDFTDSNNGKNGRLYLGKRIGGQPWDAKIEDGKHGGPTIIDRKTGLPAAESDSVTLATKDKAAQLLHRTDDLAQLAMVRPIKVDTPVSGNVMKKVLQGLGPAATRFISTKQAAGNYKAGNAELHAVQELRGFNDPPKVVSKAEMDALVAKGDHIEMLRGVKDHGSLSAKELSKEFKAGEHFPGFGCFGSGTYADAISGHGNAAVSNYGRGGDVIRMALPKDAKIIKQSELEQKVPNAPSDFRARGGHSARRCWMGVQAALAGYDAIHIDGNSKEQGTYGSKKHSDPKDFYVILNRSILTVQKESAKGHTIQ